MSFLYIFEDGKEKPVKNWAEYSAWYDTIPEDIRTGVGFTLKKDQCGDILVSTVFLGVDHGWGSQPAIWETMAFKNGEEIRCNRYSTRDEALAGHERILRDPSLGVE